MARTLFLSALPGWLNVIPVEVVARNWLPHRALEVPSTLLDKQFPVFSGYCFLKIIAIVEKY